MTIHRPDFATVSLANDLRKLEEDWLALEARLAQPHHLTIEGDLDRVHLIGGFRLHSVVTRTKLIEGSITFDVAKTVAAMLEAAYHVARRALNGMDDADVPIPYSVIDIPKITSLPPGVKVTFDTVPLLTREAEPEVTC